MQQQTQFNEEDLLTAQQLREVTSTPESLFEERRLNVLESVMSSMVKVATQQGVSQYAANLSPDFDQKLLTAIETKLTELGYTLTISDNNMAGVAHKTLTISW